MSCQFSSSVLEDAFKTANALLLVAKRDRQNIVQAMKMNDADNKLGGDNDHLEELRWYVYPKECALALSEGLSSVPGTESCEISGALRRFCLPLDSSQSTFVSPVAKKDSHISDETVNRKRKPSSPSCQSHDTLKRERPRISMCRSYDGDIFVQTYNGKSTSEADISDPTESSIVIPCDKTPASEGGPSEAIHTKKPFRDSRAWGQGSFVAVGSIVVADHKTLDPLHSNDGSKQASDDLLNHPKANKRQIHVKPPTKMMRLIIQATTQWDMIKNGDRLLLGLSGGKDSLSLLHCLLEYRRKMPVNFDVEVCTIDPMTPSFDPSPLIPYVASLGLKYHYIRDDIISRASSSGQGGKMVKSLCAFCARMKRGNLYTCARKNNCNKLVLAQHLDDCAESFMMSVMHNGFLRTMKAHYEINAGDLSVIRPMVYCRESLMTEFAKDANLPVINENCPACFEEPKERARIKKLLSREETLYPNVYDNMRRSLLPLMHDDASAILHCYTEEVVSKSRKDQRRKRPRVEGSTVSDEPRQNSAENPDSIDGSTYVATPDSVTSESNPNHQNHLESTKRNGSAQQLCDATEEELVKELARRKASRFRLAGAMGKSDDDDRQVCGLAGGSGSIPCYELME